MLDALRLGTGFTLVCGLVFGLPACKSSVGGGGEGYAKGSDASATGAGVGGSDVGAGATGVAGGAGAPAVDSDPPAPGVVDQPLRRLSHFEYANTLADLFPTFGVAPPELAADETIDGFSNHWDAMQPSALLTEQYFQVAMSIARQIDGATLADLTDCDAAACAASFVTEFGARAFRRPLEPEEQQAYLDIFESGPGASDFLLGVQLTVLAMLQSPHFLYRPEFGAGDVVDARGRRLGAFETASRLSYLLWASMPDSELMAAAEDGELSDAVGIEQHARRMLADARSERSVTQFFREWLKLNRLERVEKLPEAGWDDGFKHELSESATRFAYEQVFVPGGTGVDLLTSSSYPVTSRIASLLGETVDGSGWEVVTADPGERSGILTHPAFLGAHGYGEYPSPVLRGVYVMDRILCAPPSPPPGDVNIVLPEAPEAAPAPRTNREAYVEATSGAGCHVCHTAINGYGFAFENYDTLGQYREQDSGFDVDASGSVSGFDFVGAVDLSYQLAESDEFQSCVVEKWASYALGGSPLAKDPRLLYDLDVRFKEQGFSLRELLMAIAVHERFSGWLATTEEAP